VSVIGTATNQVIATIGVGSPGAVAAGPGGTHIYVTNGTIPGTVSVITQ
jgi:DNA-binding beta-propeller fold protein YncE